MSVSFDFSGKVVVITGSSSGIGAAIALLFAKTGANVVVTGRNAKNVSKVAKQCSDVSPNKSKILEVLADVSTEDDCKRLIDSTFKEFGKLDILVNNAGIVIPVNITDENCIENYRRIFATNLSSVIYLTHYSVKHLEKTKGNIVNISSVAAFMTMKNNTFYCMSKSAMDMFTKCMAVELGPKAIRVNSIDSGAVRTSILENFGMSKEVSDSEWDNYAKVYPVGRAGEGVDIATAVQFLASNGSTFITGTAFVADGGHSAANVGNAPVY